MIINAVEPRRGASVGRVFVEVQVQNFIDLCRFAHGASPNDQVRRVTVQALVDTGATYLCLPQSAVEQLGLTFQRFKAVRTAVAAHKLGIYATAHVAIQDRDCNTEVMAIAEGRTPLLGQIPLEMMDWWVDPVAQKLVGNPEHGGQWMAEVY
jgi:clan AA aspartic protease